MKLDIIIIGDLRFPGGTSTAIASEIAILADAGFKIGVIATFGPVLKYPHPIHPDIRIVLNRDDVEFLAQDQKVEAKLCLLHHPQIFAQWPHKPWNVTARKTLLIVHHPLKDNRGAPYYDWQKIDTVVSDLFGPVQWAPVGPKVRDQFATALNAPELHVDDWTNVLNIAEWQVPRDGFMSARPIVGRHSRPDPMKWPATRETFLQCYPDDPFFDVRLMGFGSDLSHDVGRMPDNWRILPFNDMRPRDFLATIDFFVYHHHPDWVEAYGRSIIEAMASGAVPILPPHFKPLFGSGAVYAEPANVNKTVRDLHKTPRLFLAQSKRSIAVAKDIAGPKILVDRVKALIGAPSTRRQVQPHQPFKKPKIMFFTSNGVGMGHLTRSLAVARRLPDTVDAVFITLSKAFGLVQKAGIHAEYLPFHKATKTNIDEWNTHLNREIHAAISFHNPDVFVFDGNVPYYGMIAALDEFPALSRVWMRRGMWAPNSGTEGIAREKSFHAVLEPGEIAEKWDRGLTKINRDRTVGLKPIRFLDSFEMLTRAKARQEIGIAPDSVAVLLQLGSGNNFDMTAMQKFVLDKLGNIANLQIVCAEWLIGDRTPDLPDTVIRLQEFPLSRLFNAFDFAVGAVGYNSYHEVLDAGLPTLFVPNQNPQQDEQHLRAKYAALKGMAHVAYSHDLQAAEAALSALLDPEKRASMKKACLAHRLENGANEAARYLADMAFTRRQIEGPL